jgi:hypothetical protein
VIHLVDRDHVRDLHDPGLQRLHESPEPGISTSTTVSAMPITSTSLWPAPTVSRKSRVLARRVEHEQRLERRLRQAAEVAARAHRADEDAGIEEVVAEPDPVAEQRALRERARRVDGDDADALLLRAHVPDERADQRRLADARRARDADRVGAPGLAVEVATTSYASGSPFSTSVIARASARLSPRADAGGERVARPLPAPGQRSRV